MAKTSTKSSFWDHPIVKIEEALHIRKQIEALQGKLQKLIGESSEPASLSVLKGKVGRPRKTKQTSGAVTNKVAKPTKKKGGMTPEGKAKIAAAQKARWAKKKAEATA